MIKNDYRIKENTPNGHNIICRYISLEKFLDLLLISEIFYTNLIKLTDKYSANKKYADNIDLYIMLRHARGMDEIFKGMELR